MGVMERRAEAVVAGGREAAEGRTAAAALVRH
jgi:hypothetical protein